jgi:hypothetical protein
MSIHGIRGPYGGIQPGAAPQRPVAPNTQGTGQAPQAGTPAAPVPAQAPAKAANAAAAHVPAQPPPGTDPELWSVLTQDERTYFAKLGAMGPLTYGRVLSGQLQPSAPHARGGRLDVKA